jgi:hypothetical protein
MKTRFVNILGILLLLSLVLQACGAPPPTAEANVQPPVQVLPTDTQPAPTLEPTVSEPTQTPVPTPTPIPEPTEIQHSTRPDEPSYIPEQVATDCTIGRTYVTEEPVVIPAACDNPALGFIERPLVKDTNEYLPYLDIGTSKMGGNTKWLFAQINVYDDSQPTVAGDIYYFFKIDINMDGRNSNVILIGVKNLPMEAVNWTTNGVYAWRDVDGTVSTIFDQGVGADPDLIWARRSPKAIEFAFKPDILNGPIRFAWWAWSYQGTLTPTDLALSVRQPDVYQIDNTCAWGFNVRLIGLTNQCFVQ